MMNRADQNWPEGEAIEVKDELVGWPTIDEVVEGLLAIVIRAERAVQSKKDEVL